MRERDPQARQHRFAFGRDLSAVHDEHRAEYGREPFRAGRSAVLINQTNTPFSRLLASVKLS
ncbi:hypothetical protein [Burkholderia stabilis]|uniref:hypothetical protein n=1 Tax=Burkholderia stabilis TaxID=95485 RepID=UPI00158936A6|nr:hypothetical protein [Burkholderia stabilis]